MPGYAWKTEEEDFLKANFEDMSCAEIAERLGRTERAVQHKFGQLGLERHLPSPGDKFERLEIVSTSFEKRGEQNVLMVDAKCECGNVIRTKATNVKHGHTQSCGCLRDEKAKERTIRRNMTHGLAKHPLYCVYNGMKARCKYKSMKSFKSYGERGIHVCDEWKKNFVAFYNWAIGAGWKPGLTIERKDVDGNYCPDNCKWIPLSEQHANKTNTRKLTAFGETKAACEWAKDERCKTSYGNILERIDVLKWDAERAISTPKRKLNRIV